FVALIGLKAALPLAHGRALIGKDSFLLSQAITQQAPAPVREVVFVDETALYGIRVYLDIPVLRVDYDETAKPNVDMSLPQALAQHRPGRLWLVHKHTTDKFAREVAHAGGNARQVMAYVNFRGFVVDSGAGAAQSGQATPLPRSPQ
ncbi:MAG: hypothetical protein JSS41_10660, partial [Proteobacteria bacterium]|nr:hypothetical protein [Pseudomonadota bacterium]